MLPERIGAGIHLPACISRNRPSVEWEVSKMSTISVLIGGDVCPIRRSMPYFVKRDAQSIFSDLLVEFDEADLKLLILNVR